MFEYEWTKASKNLEGLKSIKSIWSMINNLNVTFVQVYINWIINNNFLSFPNLYHQNVLVVFLEFNAFCMLDLERFEIK